jgi:hypothetical protein
MLPSTGPYPISLARPKAFNEVLARLLELNTQWAEEERLASHTERPTKGGRKMTPKSDAGGAELF